MNETSVAIIMGSDSDWPTMEDAAKVLDELGITYSVQVISAHRMPMETVDFAQSAKSHGIEVIIAAAGGAAALPGMVAALTPLRWPGFLALDCADARRHSRRHGWGRQRQECGTACRAYFRCERSGGLRKGQRSYGGNAR
jgi:hypothetical protein